MWPPVTVTDGLGAEPARIEPPGDPEPSNSIAPPCLLCIVPDSATVRIHRILLTHLSRTTIRVWRVLNTRAAASGPSACPPASGLERLDDPERAALATELPRAICERFDEKVVAAALDRVSLVLYYASTLSPAGALDKLMERFDIALLHCNWISLVFVRLHPF